MHFTSPTPGLRLSHAVNLVDDHVIRWIFQMTQPASLQLRVILFRGANTCECTPCDVLEIAPNVFQVDSPACPSLYANIRVFTDRNVEAQYTVYLAPLLLVEVDSITFDHDLFTPFNDVAGLVAYRGTTFVASGSRVTVFDEHGQLTGFDACVREGST